MRVRVQMFAGARELAGQEIIELDVASGTTVAGLRRALVEAVPAMQSLARQLLFAVDADYAEDTAVIPADAEIACIPPVSGG